MPRRKVNSESGSSASITTIDAIRFSSGQLVGDEARRMSTAKNLLEETVQKAIEGKTLEQWVKLASSYQEWEGQVREFGVIAYQADSGIELRKFEGSKREVMVSVFQRLANQLLFAIEVVQGKKTRRENIFSSN